MHHAPVSMLQLLVSISQTPMSCPPTVQSLGKLATVPAWKPLLLDQTLQSGVKVPYTQGVGDKGGILQRPLCIHIREPNGPPSMKSQ